MILNGSRDINFTMDLVVKDLSLFQAISRTGLPCRLRFPRLLLKHLSKMAKTVMAGREWSSNIVRRLEEACDDQLRAPGFPAEIDRQ